MPSDTETAEAAPTETTEAVPAEESATEVEEVLPAAAPTELLESESATDRSACACLISLPAEESALPMESLAQSAPPEQPVLTLADVSGIIGVREPAESTLGGETTCIVCFSGPKSHLAVPCGHQSVCDSCSARMTFCPYCRASVALWVRQRMV